MKLVKELDRVFSIWIRTRNADDVGNVVCFTCGKLDHWKSMDCGHFMSRKNYSTRWNDKNCQVQCKGCNVFRAGEQYRFGIRLDQVYGEGTAEQLEQLSRKTVKFLKADYEEMIDFYKKDIKKYL